MTTMTQFDDDRACVGGSQGFHMTMSPDGAPDGGCCCGHFRETESREDIHQLSQRIAQLEARNASLALRASINNVTRRLCVVEDKVLDKTGTESSKTSTMPPTDDKVRPNVTKGCKHPLPVQRKRRAKKGRTE